MAGARAAGVAVVTGASRGLGAVLADALAVGGGGGAPAAGSAAGLDAGKREIAAGGGAARSVPADVAGAEEVQGVAWRVEGELGEPDVLVNAAGGFGPLRLIVDGDPQSWV